MSTDPITVTRALTLWRPWSWAISHADKRIENRGWKPPDAMIGQHIAIHAGKRWDEDSAESLRRWFPGYEITDESIPSSRIVCVVQLLGWVHQDGMQSRGVPENRVGPLCCSRWMVGPFGWVLGEPLVLPEPVPCRGFQGVWAIPTTALSKVNEQTERAAARAHGFDIDLSRANDALDVDRALANGDCK